jgi:predicted DCC family thiol-disulfide oxidoreductase YuxK
MLDQHSIILFDAECVLCSANAQFILRHDRGRRFRLAAMRGGWAQTCSARMASIPRTRTRSSSSMAIMRCGTVTR